MRNVNGLSTVMVRRKLQERRLIYSRVRFARTRDNGRVEVLYYSSIRNMWLYLADFDSLTIDDGELYCNDLPI